MQAATLVCSMIVLLSACAPGGPPAGSANSVASNLTAAQKSAIGKKIWQNECGGTVDGLTAWNAGEEFPSIGIGHFIWYPAGYQGRFSESWPQFANFARERGANLPAVGAQAHSPWASKAEFKKDFNSARMSGLRTWLAGNVGLQTDFIIARSRASLPKMLAAAPASERARIDANYRKVATTPQGTYALIDYVNFKGEGTSASEKYQGQGWGLMQVLGGMKDVPAGPAAATEFASSAKRVLAKRVANSPAERGERRWLEGWSNRCSTYGRPL